MTKKRLLTAGQDKRRRSKLTVERKGMSQPTGRLVELGCTFFLKGATNRLDGRVCWSWIVLCRIGWNGALRHVMCAVSQPTYLLVGET